MTTAPIMFEPQDPPDIPIVPVSAEAFDAIGRERGAVIEFAADGRHIVRVRGVEYVAQVTS